MNPGAQLELRWVTTKKQKWCQFLENLHKYSLKYIGFNHAKQIMGYHACFWDILTNITHEIRDKTTYYHPLGLVRDYGGLSYHFMSKLYSNISKPSMVTPHLLCMDETHAQYFLEYFWRFSRKWHHFCFFVVTHLKPAFFQIMTWHRTGDKPLSESIAPNLPTHICVSRP